MQSVRCTAESNIPLISTQMYNDLKPGYTGGAVDVYRPHGYNLYYYDVNSLYPYVMKEYPMPVGTPKYFKGNILESSFSERPFGFFFC